MDKPWKTEIVTGSFNINRDTIHCTVEIPKDQYGKLYIYNIKRRYFGVAGRKQTTTAEVEGMFWSIT